MDTRDPIELLREGLKYERALDLLREQFGIELKPGWVHACLCRFADEIEAAYMRLPVDADGVPIRIGDVLEERQTNGETERFTVFGYTTESSTWTAGNMTLMATNEDATEFYCDRCRHVKPETVEDIIAEVYHLVREAEDERGLIADYAERIRKAVEQCNS